MTTTFTAFHWIDFRQIPSLLYKITSMAFQNIPGMRIKILMINYILSKAGARLVPIWPLLHKTVYCFGSSAVMPSAHQFMQYLHSRPWSTRRELIEVSLFHFLACSGTMTLPLLSLIGPEKTSKRLNSPVSAFCARVSLTSAGLPRDQISETPLVGVWPSMKPYRPRPPVSASK